MTEEKNIGASKQEDKFDDELLNNKELDAVTGGTGGDPRRPDNKSPGVKPKPHCH